MLLSVFLLFIAVATVVSLLNWRYGLFLIIIVGALQDPIRKLTPGAPGYLALATAPIWIAVILGVLLKEQRLLSRFSSDYRKLLTVVMIFLVSLVPAALLSATYGPGSWLLTLVGLFSYGSLLVGWLIGYAYMRNLLDARRIFAVYCLVTAVALIGTPLDYFDLFPNWSALGSTALGHEWIRYRTGYTVELIAGFFRSPDVMGWHAVTTAMLATILALTTKGGKRYAWIIIAGWAVAAAMLCGRRKMVMMLPVFAVVLTWLYWRARHGGKAATIVGMLLGILIAGVMTYEFIGRDVNIENYYLSDIDEIQDRIAGHGYHALITTYNQSGFFGEGLGTATQGTHHLKVARPRTWQEGGLGRLLVELGVPGFICFVLLGYTLLMSVFKVTLKRLDARSPAFGLIAGLVALFIANAGSFIVSHQIYGDPYVVAFFSFLIGVLLSGARFNPAYPGPSARVGAPVSMATQPAANIAASAQLQRGPAV